MSRKHQVILTVGLGVLFLIFLGYSPSRVNAISTVTITIQGPTTTPTATPTPPTPTPTPPPSGGGGSTSPPPVTGNIRITGSAFPNALVTFLDNSSVIGTSMADAASAFDKTFSGLSGTHSFSLYGQDSGNNKTVTIGFSVTVVGGSTVTVSGILLSPIVTIPDSIKRPESLTESGVAKQSSTVTTFTNSQTITKQTSTDSNGQWAIRISDILNLGEHTVSALVQDSNGNTSERTGAKSFQVKLSADLNIDGRVNLTDFSILMFSYNRNPPPNILADINDNGNAPDLVDFSIMMFYWTR